MKTPETTQTPTSKMSKKASPLLIASLGLNSVFILVAIFLAVSLLTPSFGVAKTVKNVYNRVCPDQFAEKHEEKIQGGIRTTTYYLSNEAVDSGCANELLMTAQADDYLAYPAHAKEVADTFRGLDPEGKLSITVIKLLEDGSQLSPVNMSQKQE